MKWIDIGTNHRMAIKPKLKWIIEGFAAKRMVTTKICNISVSNFLETNAYQQAKPEFEKATSIALKNCDDNWKRIQIRDKKYANLEECLAQSR
jgi:hypothetical protein